MPRKSKTVEVPEVVAVVVESVPDNLPTASIIDIIPSKKKCDSRTIEEIMDALENISKMAHELKMDLKKTKEAKKSKKGSFPKGETPPQTRAWNDFVKTVHEDMKSKAAEGETVLYKNALKEAKRRRDEASALKEA